MSSIRFTTEKLPIGDDEISLLVGRDGDEPKTVFMSYESFLEVAAALFTAVETLKVLGIDPAEPAPIPHRNGEIRQIRRAPQPGCAG